MGLNVEVQTRGFEMHYSCHHKEVEELLKFPIVVMLIFAPGVKVQTLPQGEISDLFQVLPFLVRQVCESGKR